MIPNLDDFTITTISPTAADEFLYFGMCSECTFKNKKINLFDRTKQVCWLVFVALVIRGQYKNLVTQSISALDSNP